MRNLLVLAAVLTAAFAGCLDSDASDEPTTLGPAVTADSALLLGPLLNGTLANLGNLTFETRVVAAAIDYTGDLYEPTMEVCADGSIYITGHTILVDTTGAPVFGSHDDGATWEQLPFLQSLQLPGPIQGATPPPSDEIFLSCGEDGWLYGVDITLATFPVNAWSNDGTVHAYHNPNAYDEAEVKDASTESGCVPAPAKDRPWGAYANGQLLMVSNPASGPAQVGVLDVPPALPLGIGATVGGGSWNLCAGPGTTPASCNIPGIPDLRADGQFAVPQRCEGTMVLVVGNTADLAAVTHVDLFEHNTAGEITSVYGIAGFDQAGDLFFGVSNNTYHRETRNGTSPLGMPTQQTVTVPDDGQLRFALSRDGGATFTERAYQMPGAPLRHFYMDPNDFGAGALVVWAVDGEKDSENRTLGWDWYIGHLVAGADGLPELATAFLALDDGPMPSAHVTGAAVGPDGRAYLALYEGLPQLSGGTPLSVAVQTGGATLPVDAT
jgi:hypothetical protein